MRALLIQVFFMAVCLPPARAQQLVYDKRHLNIVNENGATRLAAENTHHTYLNTINRRLDDIRLNLSAVITARQIILRSLSEADQVLKNGRAVLHISQLLEDIFHHSNQTLELARGQPWLLLFAEDAARRLKERGVQLAADVSGFVLKEGGNVLMDFEKRDFLLKKITTELQVIRALCYSLYRSMYWAKMDGIIYRANPYRSFINQDRSLAEQIIRDYKLLKD